MNRKKESMHGMGQKPCTGRTKPPPYIYIYIKTLSKNKEKITSRALQVKRPLLCSSGYYCSSYLHFIIRIPSCTAHGAHAHSACLARTPQVPTRLSISLHHLLHPEDSSSTWGLKSSCARRRARSSELSQHHFISLWFGFPNKLDSHHLRNATAASSSA